MRMRAEPGGRSGSRAEPGAELEPDEPVESMRVVEILGEGESPQDRKVDDHRVYQNGVSILGGYNHPNGARVASSENLDLNPRNAHSLANLFQNYDRGELFISQSYLEANSTHPRSETALRNSLPEHVTLEYGDYFSK